MYSQTQGFTLIELMIVVAIIGILAAVLIPNLLGARKRAYDTAAVACARSLATAQGIALQDDSKYKQIGNGANQINRTTDGVNQSCWQPDVYVADRSVTSGLVTTYTIDVWHAKGSRVITITPAALGSGVVGATAFSNTGAGGVAFP
ncbi:pilin [Deinococcus hohokamensis]|uniref:Prepilin-type N-terminal cleavage/methylation domain-containing protein n=1 Tax=Deinococcus hohokamensis TaxID=309883 RepID=A0ABV9I5T9_9DEIO